MYWVLIIPVHYKPSKVFSVSTFTGIVKCYSVIRLKYLHSSDAVSYEHFKEKKILFGRPKALVCCTVCKCI